MCIQGFSELFLMQVAKDHCFNQWTEVLGVRVIEEIPVVLEEYKSGDKGSPLVSLLEWMVSSYTNEQRSPKKSKPVLTLICPQIIWAATRALKLIRLEKRKRLPRGFDNLLVQIDKLFGIRPNRFIFQDAPSCEDIYLKHYAKPH